MNPRPTDCDANALTTTSSRRTILATIDFLKTFDSVWHPALFHSHISVGLPPCFARWTKSVLFNRRFEWFFKITKVVPFECIEVFWKDLFLALYFSLFLSVIFLFLCLLSAAYFMLTIRPFSLPPPRSLLR